MVNINGPNKWVVNNSRTGKETACSIKDGENIEYPASAIIKFDEHLYDRDCGEGRAAEVDEMSEYDSKHRGETK